jgi:chromate transporter
MTITMSAGDWLTLLGNFLALSLMSIGGVITTLPDMHRTLVNEHHWLTDSQFNASVALAQAAPGPNVLFVALMGWHVGLNAGGGMAAGWPAWATSLLGVMVSMLGILFPSTILTFAAARWGHQNRERRAVRAFKQGLAPVVIALLIATGWILTLGHGTELAHWPLWLLSAVAAVVVWRTRLHLLWLLVAGAVLGWFGWV